MALVLGATGFSTGLWAQTTTTTGTTVATDGTGAQQQNVTTTTVIGSKKDKDKDNKVVQSKDTKKNYKKDKKIDTLAGIDANLPDKALYDKAQIAIKKGHFDVARLDLQTMLNTYPDSQYQMRAKLAIADSWYSEGGTAALTQAESEYADFRVFFPNSPEAAEAQMRIGDIYFRQMDKPDRDYSKATHAEEEYRRMLTDYPDSTLVPQAKQRLRDVQEVLATRESDIASYYATRDNWSAVIARYQTVIDTYPLYSHIDDALIALGDAYASEAKIIRGMKLPEGPRAELLRIYEERAASAYRKVVLEHSASPHVEDARDRLTAMNLPIPTPTAEQIAASKTLEDSRNSYKLQDRVGLIILHRPDTVTVAHVGEPTLTDPKATLAPDITRQTQRDFVKAMMPTASAAAPTPAPAATATAETPATAPAPANSAPLQFQEVPTDGSGTPSNAVMTANPGSSSAVHTSGGLGVEIISHSGDNSPAALPPIEKPAEAPAVVNEVAGKPQAAAQAPPANGKAPKPAFDKDDESSSKHKKKKGLKKILPPL
jgi:outer membrane protein assembly factor BamD